MKKFNPDRIRALREARGLTLEAFAQGIGVQRQHVDGWEHGRAKPRIDSLIAISNTYGVEISYFFADEEHLSSCAKKVKAS